MAEPTINCPKCGAKIDVSEILYRQVQEQLKKEYDEKSAKKEKELEKKVKSLDEEKEKLEKDREHLQKQINEGIKAKLNSEKLKMEKSIREEMKEETDAQIKSLQRELEQKSGQVKDLNKAKAEIEKLKREKNELRDEVALEKEKEYSEKLKEERVKIQKQLDESSTMKIRELEKQLDDQKKLAEEMKRKAEQGSQQLQGEVQELELESLLRSKFPHDLIEPVAKGEHGGDVLQRVVSPLGQQSGTIIWESKRTKAWSDSWLPKLREDQRAAKAEIAVIVSQSLPKNVDLFDLVDGVYVTTPKAALAVALLLRQGLIETASARLATEGQQTKMEMVYQYLTGPRFRQRVQAIVEAFSTMQENLDREKKAITKQWAKREEQIEHVMVATVGMYGDLQGIAGKTMQEIEGLDMKLLGSNENQTGE
jgi:hypothetical protein